MDSKNVNVNNLHEVNLVQTYTCKISPHPLDHNEALIFNNFQKVRNQHFEIETNFGKKKITFAGIRS